MGKSLYIKRKAEVLTKLNPHSKGCVTIPVHGPIVNSESVMDFLKDHMENSTGTIFHIDISPSVSSCYNYVTRSRIKGHFPQSRNMYFKLHISVDIMKCEV